MIAQNSYSQNKIKKFFIKKSIYVVFLYHLLLPCLFKSVLYLEDKRFLNDFFLLHSQLHHDECFI